MARSNSANTPVIWHIALPTGVLVSRLVLTHHRRRSEVSQRKMSATLYFARRHLLFWWPNLIAQSGVAPSHGGKFS